MSGWIKLEKHLLTDPRVIRMGTKLCNGGPLRGVTVVLGGLAHLWMLADTHIGNDDVIPLGADEINDVIGIDGFCQLLPQDWLQVIDSDHIKLPGFHTHNGTVAKERAQTAKRVQKHRTITNAKPLQRRNAQPLPDLDQDQDLNQDSEKHTETHAANGNSKDVSRETEDQIRLRVIAIKAIYPKASREDWITAEKLMRNIVTNGGSWEEIEAGVGRYQRLCKATHRIAQNPGLFFGAVDRPWLQEWPLPSSKAESMRDQNIETSQEWLRAAQ